MKQDALASTPIEVFITVALALFGLVLMAYLILSSKLTEHKEAAAKAVTEAKEKVEKAVDDVKDELNQVNKSISAHDEQHKTSFKMLNTLTTEIRFLHEGRREDSLRFADALTKLNTTLGKLESTLEHVNETMAKSMTNLEERVRETEDHLIRIINKNQ